MIDQVVRMVMLSVTMLLVTTVMLVITDREEEDDDCDYNGFGEEEHNPSIFDNGNGSGDEESNADFDDSPNIK